MPPQAKTPCEEHADRLGRIESRLEKGDDNFSELRDLLKEIKVAVCGDSRLGIPGLVALHEKVEALERQRTWLLGAAAVVGVAFPLVWNIFIK